VLKCAHLTQFVLLGVMLCDGHNLLSQRLYVFWQLLKFSNDPNFDSMLMQMFSAIMQNKISAAHSSRNHSLQHAAYRSCKILVSFCRASSIKLSTSSFDRLKFSALKAYTVTSGTPKS